MTRDTTLAAVLADKQVLRQQAAAKPFATKLRILEHIRDRDAAIRGSLRQGNPTRDR